MVLIAGASLMAIECAHAAGGAYAVDDAEVGAPGSCKVEAWTSWASNGDFAGVASPACVTNLGHPVELGVMLQRSRSDGDWGTSATLKGKINIVPVATGKLGLGLLGGTSFDLLTGRNSAVAFAIPLTFAASEQFRINVNGGWLWDRNALQHFFTWGAGVEWTLAKPVTLIGEVFGQSGSGPGTIQSPRVQAGLRFSPVDKVDIDLIYGRNVTGENANWITLGLNLRL